MAFVSTRGGSPPVSLGRSLADGLAPDGGLYVPEVLPRVPAGTFEADLPLPRFAARVLDPLFDGDPLRDDLAAICTEAFTFPIPLVPLNDAIHPDRRTAVLELFHGPTSAFKDVGARFLAACFGRIGNGDRVILVATSGDTGGAVAAAFHGRPGIRVGVLFPRDGVTGRQRAQLSAFGDNVQAFAIDGTFDACQALLKKTLATMRTREPGRWTTANSINTGRLLPQIVYHAWGAVQARNPDLPFPDWIVPSGNAGNAVAALWARTMGFPIGPVVLATNANPTISEYIQTGTLTARPSLRTLANAMDVGNPSNLERMIRLFDEHPDQRDAVTAVRVEDETIRHTITEGPGRFGQIWDPHTATGIHARDTRPGSPAAVVVATAHPAKFESIVEPLIGAPVPVPPALADLLARPSRVVELEPEPDALIRAMGTGG